MRAIRWWQALLCPIAAAMTGGKKRSFSFSTLGQLAAIGYRPGVANLLGINFSGFAACGYDA